MLWLSKASLSSMICDGPRGVLVSLSRSNAELSFILEFQRNALGPIESSSVRPDGRIDHSSECFTLRIGVSELSGLKP